MKKYRKKPVVIEAMQLTRTNAKGIWTFIGKPITLPNRIDHEKWDEYLDIVNKKGIRIETLEGVMTAQVGDYIIKGIQGEFYPCKPDIFEKTYEIAE